VRLFLVLQCERGRGSLESVTFPLGYGNWRVFCGHQILGRRMRRMFHVR
jgi:hypothetical protein